MIIILTNFFLKKMTKTTKINFCIIIFFFFTIMLFSCQPKGINLFKRFHAQDSTFLAVADDIDISAYQFIITYIRRENDSILKDSVDLFKVRIGEKNWIGYNHQYGHGYLYISPTIQIKINSKQVPDTKYVYIDTDEQFLYGDYINHSYLITEESLTIWIDTKDLASKLFSKHLYITVVN